MPMAPIMIYGDDVTHIVTEEGVAYLCKTEGLEERKAAIAAIAGATEIGRRAEPARTAELGRRGIVATPEDLGCPPDRGEPDAVGGTQYRRPGRLV